ncbi:fibulin-1-like isoform X1 [Pseudochaenichthys georgianus]|uniref:fibulin-1-like isoform X1 n=1 Tax=Pseudochaenichthys georgianus TaxID=52239 RepID=UPI00146B5D27|nr:fibulin-1-like isoform X1 [Pseudochaenichthys georgianus]
MGGKHLNVTPWALWTILSFFLYGVLHGQDVQATLRECCQYGMDRYLEGHDCTILPLISISISHTCRITQEQCCAAAAGDQFCDKGMEMAKEQGACEWPFFSGGPWETKISKMCCDCCLLGLMIASQASSCELQGLSLERQCTHTAKSCCGINLADEPKQTVTEKPVANFTTMPPEGSNGCRDSNCSLLCVGNGTCACLDGYQLQNDGVSCVDSNECLTDNHNCVSGQVCINTEGSFRCQRETSCGTGYELRNDNDCHDIDECALGFHNCGPDFVCNNTEGSFRCYPKESCPIGYIQDAVGNCNDFNECVAYASPCLPGETCNNTEGSYTCRRNKIPCGRGYHLIEDGTRCEDVDECRTGIVCGVHGCVNLVGTYRCECRNGFIFNSISKLCEDINECRHYPAQLCAHKCENTEGSYKCSCTIGFQLTPDGRSCEDVNECEANPCSQECANVYGSYQCYCRRGYQLSDIDGIACEDIDECALPTGGHVCSYRCSNAPGSFYCTCPPTGYTLAHNGRTCQDIDECSTGIHTCSVSESCFNIQGGFRCLFFACPQNFRQAAQGSGGDALINVRCIKSCHPHDISCNIKPVHTITHTSLSLPTFRDFHEPEEIVVLRTVTAANSAVPGATDVFFDIQYTDDQLSFDVEKRTYHGMIIGVVRQVKPIIGPRDLVIEVAMNYIKSRAVSHRNIVMIHVFISELWF